MAYPCNGQAGVDHAAPSQYLEFPPINGWKNEMKDDGWWLIKINSVTKSKLYNNNKDT